MKSSPWETYRIFLSVWLGGNAHRVYTSDGKHHWENNNHSVNITLAEGGD